MSKRGIFSKQLLFSLLCLSTTLQGMPAHALDANALPEGGVVVGGSANFDYSKPNELHVQQNTDKAVINWNSFNIGEQATTQFHQNSSNAIAVNRVVGKGIDPTQIMGTLKANGKIVVLDRNGVIFGQNSRVDVGGIVASTGNIDDRAFMDSGQLKITGADTGGAIVNHGTISVRDAGLAAFVSPTVKNHGVINAKLGKVTLAAGDEATVDLYGDGLVELAAGKNLTDALVENTGAINAEGGIVTLTASGAKDIVNTVINTSGIINVASVTAEGGRIVLEGANTQVSGTLDASGKTGGGTILVGGDYQGKGTTKTANKTTITKTAKIKANATGETGKGGKVIVWADDSTKFDGKIEAKGGYISGDGGFVETSGKINLGVSGDVDASATNGLAGSWLLDPSNVYIYGWSGNNVGGGTVNPTSDSYEIFAGSIEAALNAGNDVTITTSNPAGTEAGDIIFGWGTTIQKTSGGSATLTLQADRNIFLDTVTIGSSGTGDKLNLVFNADRDANHDGAILFQGVQFDTNNGYFVAGGGSGTVGGADGILGNGDGTGADDMAAWGSASYINGINLGSSTISTGAGDIILNGHGSDLDPNLHSLKGVLIVGSTLETSSGAVRINGEGGTGDSGNFGIWFYGTSLITTETGEIELKGHGGTNSGGSVNLGIQIDNATIESTGTGPSAGDISIEGIGASSSGFFNIGLEIVGSSLIRSGYGDIYLSGTGNAAATNYSGSNMGVSVKNSLVESTGTGTNAAKISINGLGGAGSEDSNFGFFLENAVLQTVDGDIEVTGQGRSYITNGGGNAGIRLNNGEITSSGDADISLTAIQAVTGTQTSDFEMQGTSLLGGAGATGNIKFNLDTIDLQSGLIKTSSSVDIMPRTASTSIGLAGGVGLLNLTTAELGKFEVNRLNIGDYQNGAGDIDVGNWDLSGLNYSVDLSGDNINLAGLTLGSRDFFANAGVTWFQTGDITITGSINKTGSGMSLLTLNADNDITSSYDIHSSNASFDVSLNAGHDLTLSNILIDPNGGELNLHAGNDLSYTSPDAITVNTVSGRTVFLQSGAGKDITTKGTITTTGSGNAAVLASGGNFINSYGANLFSISGGGRWLVYSADPGLNTRGGLTPGEDAIFGETYSSLSPSAVPSGNRYIFSTAFVNDPGVMKPVPPPSPPVASPKPTAPVRDFENYVVGLDKVKVMDRSVDIKQVEISSTPFMLQVQYPSLQRGTDMVYEDEKVVIK